MPEIAEVEIVRRGLLPLRGQRLQRIEAVDKFYLPDRLVGQELEDIKRHGKVLGFFFSDDIKVKAHLRMTGKFLWEDGPHRKARLSFSENTLFFLDPRGFATMDLVEIWPGNIGPDLWASPTFLPQTSSSRSVKAYLLDQKNLAGIGNYLADESLFRAGIHPLSKAKDLTGDDWEKVLAAARDLSGEVLKRGGVSLRDYVDTNNRRGGGGDLLRVYGRGGKECFACSSLLEKTRVAGRGTVFCSSCQTILPALSL